MPCSRVFEPRWKVEPDEEAHSAYRRSSVRAFERLGNGDQISRERRFEQLIGSSPALESVLEQVERVAATDSTVLIQGETGTGKELIARAVHNISTRCRRSFVKQYIAASRLAHQTAQTRWHTRLRFNRAHVSRRFCR